MDSTRPIRALIRGLEALAVLNRRNGATVSEVTSEIKLPRTTTYRGYEVVKPGFWTQGPVMLEASAKGTGSGEP